MTDVACGECGASIPGESADVDVQNRQPCPRCGSKKRAFSIQIGGTLTTSGSVDASVTRRLVELTRLEQIPTIAVQGVDDLAVSDAASTQVVEVLQTAPGPEIFPSTVRAFPDVLLQAAVVRLGTETSDGQLIAGVAVSWFEIIAELERDPDFLFKIHWRKLEELVAGAYERAGWPEVILTPRRGDAGRDIIATKPGVVSIRIVDQIKAYRPGHVVTADEVRSMLGALSVEQNVSKGLVTTTSVFAPGIEKDARLARFMPYRLELKNGEQLLNWLTSLGAKGGGS